MKNYLIVGKPFKNLSQKILELGHEYTLLQDVLTTKYPDKKFKRRVLADFSDKQALLKTASELPGNFSGVITVYENYVLPAAWIAEALDLPGMPVAAAEACTDKFTMRSLFNQAPEKISPDFAIVNNEEDVKNFAENHQFPLILKPANLAKSLLVTKNNSLEELLANYKKTTSQIDAIYRRYAPHRQPKVIIEEFMTGSIHSVDAFIDSDGTPHVLDQIVDYQTGYDIGFEDNFHYSRLLPSKLSEQDQDKLREVAAMGARALDMKNSPAHIEIIMTATGPQIVEIGARNGGYRERMHGLANGIDILGAALETAGGQQPNITATRNDACAVLELFPKYPGKFKGISHEAILRTLPSFKYLGLKAKYGQFAGKSADGYKMCAVIILHDSNKAQFNKDLRFVNEEVYVETISSK